MGPALHIHQCAIGVGLELTVCSLEGLSCDHVPFLCRSTRIKYLQLPLALEHKRLARIPNFVTPPLPRAEVKPPPLAEAPAGPSAIDVTAQDHVIISDGARA